MADRRAGGQRALGIIAGAGVAVGAALAAFQLADVCVTARGAPLWDRATHGLAGVELARALRHGDLIAFLLGLNRQVVWPFLHPLLLTPWLLARGESFAAADQLSSLLFAGTALSIFLAGRFLHPTRGPWVGAAAAALALLAPEYRLFGTLAMLEMPGALLLAATLALWLRSERGPESTRWLAAAGIGTAALFLCKYNYGLLWLVPLACQEALRERERLAAAGRTILRERRWARLFPSFMLAFAAVLVAILVTGGAEFSLFGVPVSVRSPGNPAYVYYLLLLGWAVVRVRRAGGARRTWRSLSPRLRVLAATVGAPLAVWFLIPVPNRVKNFFGFVTNRDSGAPLWTLEGLLFYPRAFAEAYSPHPIAGWIVLALSLVPPRARGRADRLLYGALVFGLLATMAHRYHDPRFLFTTAILVWLRAAQTAVAVTDLLLTRARPWLRETAWTMALAALFAWAWAFAPPRRAVEEAHRLWNAPAGFEAVLDRVLEHVARTPERAVLLGYSDWLSPALLHWHALLTRPDVPPARLPDQPAWLPAGADEAAIAARIEKLRAAGSPVIAALPAGPLPAAAADYRAGVWADSVTAARLSRDPRVTRVAVDLVTGTPTPFAVSAFRCRRADRDGRASSGH